MNIAVILSGGSGKRFGGSLPKQFTKLAGKSIIEYTIDVFQRSKDIDKIIVVSQPEYSNRIWNLAHDNNWTKVSKVVAAGKERFDSTYSAVKSMAQLEGATKVLFHDAVRPLVDHRIISDCIKALEDFDAVDVVIPSADTLVQVYDNGCIDNIPNRNLMRRGQTPQAFRLSCIREAYEKAVSMQRSVFTCDCGVVRAMLPQVRVVTVNGTIKNRKITSPIDLFIVEKFLQTSKGSGMQLSANPEYLVNKNIIVFGGNSGIGLEIRNMAITYGANVFVASRSVNNVDVCDIVQVKQFINDIYEKYGDIDYVINSSGYLLKKPLDMLSYDEVNKLVSINFNGVVNVAIAVKKYLEKTSGMLLNFTSSSYTRGRANYALYSSSNAAVVNFTQAIADEWSKNNIKVNCINPERTATPMRVANFGIEDKDSLLSASDVASTSLNVLLQSFSGVVVDVRKNGR